MKKLRIIILIAVFVIFAAATLPRLILNAGLPADDKVFNSGEFFDLMGGAYDKASINVKNMSTISLDVVFADHEKAMAEIKDMLKPFLFELSIKYSLPEFSPETINEYQEALFLYREDNYRASKGAPPYKMNALSFFCQIYNNAEENAKILKEKEIKSDMETVLSCLFKVSSKGYIVQYHSFNAVRLMVSEMLEYMKKTFDLDILTDDTIDVYREHLDEVPDDPYAIDKDILEKFFEIYTNQ